MIPKPGKDPKLAENLRHISLLSSTSKVFERLVQRRVREYLDIFNILVPEQLGFRDGHSSTHILMRFVETVGDAGCSKKQTAPVFLDVEKAFDCVWRTGLIYKLT